jgi:hypothetical protein
MRTRCENGKLLKRVLRDRYAEAAAASARTDKAPAAA